MLDPVKNFAKVTVSTGYDASATTIVLSGGDGAELPAPATDGAFNLVWWNFTDYKDPSDDPSVEIVRCTARTDDTLTIARAQEDTSASTKNTAGKIYKMALCFTKKSIDEIRQYGLGVKAGTDIASYATIDLGAATGAVVSITGTTGISAMGTVEAGVLRLVKFVGALILTHNATSLILPTGANITTAAGDTAIFVSLGSGNWKCSVYQRADGSSLAGGGGETGTYGESITAGDCLSAVGLATSTDDIVVQYDTYVNSGAATTNYNTATTFEVGSTNYENLVKFNPASFPAGMAMIVSLSFKIYCSWTNQVGVTFKTITSAWTSSTVTWNTKPTYGNTIGSKTFTDPTNAWVAITITPTNQADSDYIVANGFMFVKSGTNNATLETSENASGHVPYIDSITYLGNDGRLYKADASYLASVNAFVGFAVESGAADQEKAIQTGGILTTSGLTPLTTYYISNTAGAISTSAGTNSKKIGRSLGDATQLLIVQPPL